MGKKKGKQVNVVAIPKRFKIFALNSVISECPEQNGKYYATQEEARAQAVRYLRPGGDSMVIAEVIEVIRLKPPKHDVCFAVTEEKPCD